MECNEYKVTMVNALPWSIYRKHTVYIVSGTQPLLSSREKGESGQKAGVKECTVCWNASALPIVSLMRHNCVLVCFD